MTITPEMAVADADTVVEVILTAAAGITHGAVGDGTVAVDISDVGTATATDPADGTYATTSLPGVVVTTSNAGATPRWTIRFIAPTAVSDGNTEIVVSFDRATVPSSIAKTDITVQNTTTGSLDTSVLSIDPVKEGAAGIAFFSPVELASGNTASIIISPRAGVAHSGTPGTATVTVTIGDTALESDDFQVIPYLNISPTKGAHGTTVTVTGGGFTARTAGSLMLAGANIGSYTVDSSGKLTGSFVATKGSGKVSVRDLGRGTVVDGPDFTQTASATPMATEVAQGGSVNVTLRDFPEVPENGRLAVTAKIGGGDPSMPSYPTGNTYSLHVPQGEATGTKLVEITGRAQMLTAGGDTSNDPSDDTYANTDDPAGMDTFLITIVGRTLTVSPSSAVPGQAVTVSGVGFGGIATVDLTLTGEDGPVTGGNDIRVNTDGSFLYTGKVPFNSSTADAGSKTWKATGYTTVGNVLREASSSGFTIQKRAITLSPSTANPGATVEVVGSGFGVATDGNVTSQVSITVTGTSAVYGPFPVSSTGEFTGAFTVPADVGVSTLTVTAKDNNGTDDAGSNELTNGFDRGENDDADGNQSATASLRIPQGVVSVSPSSASTGSIITVSGQGFPAQTNLSALTFGDGNALPVPAPATDVSGNFTVTLTVPARAQGGSLPPGAVVITAKVGEISGTTSFTIPGPSITLSASSAAPGEMITVSGMNFGAYANVGTINVGRQNQAPTPNPLTDGTGNFSAQVLIPALNPGAYTVTVRTDPEFTATAPITIVSPTAGGVTPEVAFQALTSRGLLTLAAAAAPGGTAFGAYVPGLAGNTLVQVEPNGVLILTLNADARIAVSSQPAVDVAADTPTFFALGSSVTVEVIE